MATTAVGVGVGVVRVVRWWPCVLLDPNIMGLYHRCYRYSGHHRVCGNSGHSIGLDGEMPVAFLVF